MRVLLTTDTVGGVWTFTRELATGLLRRGHAVALVSFGRLPNSEQQAWVRATQYLGEFVYEASAAPLEWMNGNAHAMEGECALAATAESFAPDLLHSNQFCFGAYTGAGPCIVTAHSDVLSWASACRLGELEDSAWLRRYRTLVQQGLAGAHAVAAPTTWMMDALERNFKLPAMREAILNGRSFARRQAVAKTLQAVTVGRLWDEAKGLRTLEDLKPALPVILAGEQHGEDGKAHLPAELDYAGLLDEEALLSLFDRSALYLTASIYEPFGLAPLEAALCGCGVVSNDLPSLREVWGDGALYYSGRDGLQALLQHLQADAELLARARRRSKARALELTAARMTERYVSLYKRVLAQDEATPQAGMMYAH